MYKHFPNTNGQGQSTHFQLSVHKLEVYESIHCAFFLLFDNTQTTNQHEPTWTYTWTNINQHKPSAYQPSSPCFTLRSVIGWSLLVRTAGSRPRGLERSVLDLAASSSPPAGWRPMRRNLRECSWYLAKVISNQDQPGSAWLRYQPGWSTCWLSMAKVEAPITKQFDDNMKYHQPPRWLPTSFWMN